jgi:uncharacterized membrane protein YqhA
MRRLIELSRFAVAVPAVTSIIASFVLMAIGVWEVVMTIIHLLDSSVSVKLTVVAILTAVDTFLLATVLLVIGYGLYELFVDSEVTLPKWLQIRSLDDLKTKLIGVTVAILGVVFLGALVDRRDASSVMFIGAGVGAVIIGLAAFTFASKRKDGG